MGTVINTIVAGGGGSKGPETFYASDLGCPGGTSDDSSTFHAMLAAVPTGSRILLANTRYTIKTGGVYNKQISLEGSGPRTEIYFNPTVAGTTMLRFDPTGSTVADRNEEGQLYGPTIRNLRILGKREILAHALHFYRCDNVCIENVFVEGIAGSSVYLDRSRETHINGLRTRFCGNQDNQIPDINIVSIEGSADTSNYQLWENITCVYPFWTGVYLYNADQIYFTNLFIHQFKLADENERTFVGNRFGNSPNLYTLWETNFNNASNGTPPGGIYAKCLDITGGSSARISNIILRGGTVNKVVNIDSSNAFVSLGEVSGGHATTGTLFYVDNSGQLYYDNLFLDNSNQMFIENNSGAVYGVNKRGPTFAANQTQPGSQIMEAYGAEMRYKHGVKFQNVFTLDENIAINTGTTTGSKIGNTNSQKLGFWGATPVTRPTVTGSKGGNAALTSLCSQLAAAGLITDSTT